MSLVLAQLDFRVFDLSIHECLDIALHSLRCPPLGLTVLLHFLDVSLGSQISSLLVIVALGEGLASILRLHSTGASSVIHELLDIVALCFLVSIVSIQFV